MERFYDGTDSKSVRLYAVVTHRWRGTYMVFVLYLKIKLSLFRSQCKCSQCRNQSGSPESRSYVRLCCLITGCPWQQCWTSVPSDLICHQHVVSAKTVLLQQQSTAKPHPCMVCRHKFCHSNFIFNSWKNNVLMFTQIVCSFFFMQSEAWERWMSSSTFICLSVCLPACLPLRVCGNGWHGLA